MAKRPPSGDVAPVAKKPLLMQGPLFIPPATSQEDLDVKVLQVGVWSSKNRAGGHATILFKNCSGIFGHVTVYYALSWSSNFVIFGHVIRCRTGSCQSD